MISLQLPSRDRAADMAACGVEPPKRRVSTALALLGLLIASFIVAGVAAWQLDQYEARQYRRFCIERTTDQGRCNHGPAVEPRRRCLFGEWPPGIAPEGPLPTCVQAWLAYESP